MEPPPAEEGKAMVDDDDDSSDDDSSDGGDDLPDLAALEAKVAETPTNYEAHAALVGGLRQHMKFPELKKARLAMQSAFPLPTGVWTEWITDELRMAGNAVDRNGVLDLCATAVRDYLSVPVWLTYVELAQELCLENDKPDANAIASVRTVFDAALEACGTHLLEGRKVWKAFIAFEETLIENATGEAKEEGLQRARQLHLGALATPFVDMESGLTEYKEWEKDLDENFRLGLDVGQTYKKAASLLDARVTYEERVVLARQAGAAVGTGNDELKAAWMEYLDYEVGASKKTKPNRAQALFERAVADMFLVPDVWLKYGSFLQNNLRKHDLIQDMYHRATRNASWSGALWAGYLTSLERAAADPSRIQAVYQRALQAGLGGAADYITIALYMANFHRRAGGLGELYRVGDGGASLADNPHVISLRECLAGAVHYLGYLEGKDVHDHTYTVYKYWANLEVVVLGNVDGGRGLWEQLLQAKPTEHRGWLEYVAVERVFGSIDATRALFKRALEAVTAPDWAALEVGRNWLSFERQAGSLQDCDKAERRCEKLLKTVLSRPPRAAPRPVGRADYQDREGAGGRERKSSEKKGQDKYEDRSQDKYEKKGQDKYQKKPQDQDQKAPAATAPPATALAKDAAPAKPAKASEAKSGAKSGDKSGDKRKNTDDDSNDSMPPPPTKKQKVAPADPAKATKSQEPEAAGGKKKEEKEDFSRLKNDKSGRTLFVLNLAWTVKEDALTTLFAEHGTVTEVKIVKNFKGMSKGFAYVQLRTKEEADGAMAKLDGHEMGGRIITVTPSQEPPKRNVSGEAEKNTAYISNLPRVDHIRELLMTKFGSCGEVKEVRLPRDREGRFKKIAFMEFATPAALAAAVALHKTYLTEPSEHKATTADGKTVKTSVVIKVTISKPPTKEERQQMLDSRKRPEDREKRRSRTKSSSLQLVPRNVKQAAVKAAAAAAAAAIPAAAPAPATGAPKTNNDFRAMLLAGKK